MKFLQSTTSVFFAFFVMLSPSASLANNSTPDALVKAAIEDATKAIAQDQDIAAGNRKKAVELVEKLALPYFNVAHMTILALGKYSREATPEQITKLTAEFRTLLLYTYSAMLFSYKDYELTVKPLRMNPGDINVVVKIEAKRPGTNAPTITIALSLENILGQWGVYDVLIDGISLVISYRNTFANEIKRNGIDGLIASLVQKNRELEKSF